MAPLLGLDQEFTVLDGLVGSLLNSRPEGTEFDVQEARGFVLDGKPIEHRPKDSHDIIGVFEQALSPTRSRLTLPAGEPVLEQMRARHRHQMERRPEVNPGEFKLKSHHHANPVS